MYTKGKITISIVSHGQLEMVAKLFSDLDKIQLKQYIDQVILIKNIPEEGKVTLKQLPLKVVENKAPIGFSQNHNQAFKLSKSKFFCVINPDVRIDNNVFQTILDTFNINNKVGIVSPYVFSSLGERENNIRYFPKLLTVIKKFFGYSELHYPEASDVMPYPIEWAAGMFLVFNAELYKEIKGFDESFFLYYEDVDICVRCWKADWFVYSCPQVAVIHDGQRASHNEWKYLKWHFSSLLRYFVKHLRSLPNIN